MRSSAKSMSGWRAGREPVAIRIAAPFTRLAPSLPAISTVCGSTKLATPCRQVTPWRARLSRMRCDSEATMLALLAPLHAVHEDVLHADRIGMRLLVGRRVGDGRGIEDDDVGIHPFLDQAAALEPEIARRQPGHPAHGLLQRYHLVLAHVLAEQAGQVAVRTRMRRFPHEDALGRHRGAVGADPNPHPLELLRQLLPPP